jgi:hypothetical protein
MRKMKILVKPGIVARHSNQFLRYSGRVFILWELAVHSEEFLIGTNNLKITCWRLGWSFQKRQNYCFGRGAVLLAAIEERSRQFCLTMLDLSGRQGANPKYGIIHASTNTGSIVERCIYGFCIRSPENPMRSRFYNGY